jgi:hypothetical protein
MFTATFLQIGNDHVLYTELSIELISYNSLSNVLHVGNYSCLKTFIKERNIDVVEVCLIIPSPTFNLISECRALNEWM